MQADSLPTEPLGKPKGCCTSLLTFRAGLPRRCTHPATSSLSPVTLSPAAAPQRRNHPWLLTGGSQPPGAEPPLQAREPLLLRLLAPTSPGSLRTPSFTALLPRPAPLHCGLLPHPRAPGRFTHSLLKQSPHRSFRASETPSATDATQPLHHLAVQLKHRASQSQTPVHLEQEAPLKGPSTSCLKEPSIPVRPAPDNTVIHPVPCSHICSTS